MDKDNIIRKINRLDSSIALTNKKALDVIKSNMMLKYKVLVSEERAKVSTDPVCCKWCLNAWSPGNYKVVLKPQKQPKRHLRSLLKKDLSSLNKYQQKLVLKVKKSSTSNILVLHCLVCSRSTSTTLRKRKFELKTKEKSHVEKVEIVKKKKKRKKKDKFAGLKAEVVQKCQNLSNIELCKKPVKHPAKKSVKEISFQQQLYIHRALAQVQVQKKKPSLLETFLDSM